jgi:hypothetical protein
MRVNEERVISFRIHGRLVHLLASLISFSQMYGAVADLGFEPWVVLIKNVNCY